MVRVEGSGGPSAAGFCVGTGLSGPGAVNTLSHHPDLGAGSAAGVAVGSTSSPHTAVSRTAAGNTVAGTAAGDKSAGTAAAVAEKRKRGSATAGAEDRAGDNEARAGGGAGEPPLHWGAPAASARGPRSLGAAVMLLVIVLGSLARPFFFALDGALPSAPIAHGGTREETVRAGADLAAQLGFGGSACWLASETLVAGTVTRAVALPLLGALDGPTRAMVAAVSAAHPLSALVPLSSVWGSPIEAACITVMSLLSSLSAQSRAPARPDPAAPSLGPANQDRGPPNSAAADLEAWGRATEDMAAADSSLCDALTSTAVAHPFSQYLTECAGRIGDAARPLATQTPSELRSAGDPISDEALSALPFSRRSSPAATTRLPPPAAQPPTQLQPRSLDDILTPEAQRTIRDWLRIEANNIAAMGRHGLGARKHPHAEAAFGFGEAIQRHGTLVIGQEGFVEGARGVIWDCRPFALGLPAHPLRFDGGPHTYLHRDYLDTAFTDWPDQEIVGLVADGVQFRADMPLQFVFSPQLQSLANAAEAVGEQIWQFVDEGLFDMHTALPFAPAHFMPIGAAAKKGSGKWRRTSDGGAPRQDCFDGEGVRAKSINEGIGLKLWDEDDPSPPQGPDGTEAARGAPKWQAQEVKPRVADVMYDGTVLRHAGRILHEPLLGFVDDFARFFNQIPLHPSEQWLVNHVWPSKRGSLKRGEVGTGAQGTLGFVSEKRLGFGLTISSNVGQRFADLVVADFIRRMEATEAPFWSATLDPSTGVCHGYGALDELSRSPTGWTDACRWIARRRTLARRTGHVELRAYAVHVYTDDVIITALGNGRMARALVCWRETTQAFGLEMAGAEKRQLGTSVTWLGFSFFLPTGVIAVTPAKRAKALDALDNLMAWAPTTFGEYRKLLGFLEHLLVVVGGDRTYMYHLYGDNFRRGARFGAATIMILQAAQQESLQRWWQTLHTRAGSFFSAALSPHAVVAPPFPNHAVASGAQLRALRPPPTPAFYLFSDAANEATTAGLGGWVHGDWWHVPLSREDQSLFHITAMEMIALGVNVIMFGEKLQGAAVMLCADALATVDIMNACSAHSPALQSIHARILALPEFAALAPALRTAHVYGEVNVMADASSRARFELIDSIATQLGMAHRRVGLPARAEEFLQAVRADARLRSATADDKSRNTAREGPGYGAAGKANFGAAARDGATSSPATSSPRL